MKMKTTWKLNHKKCTKLQIKFEKLLIGQNALVSESMLEIE